MKKIFGFALLVIVLLVSISFASAVNSNKEKDIGYKESPLYTIRKAKYFKDKIGEIFEKIKTKFLGERIFFMPFQKFQNVYNVYLLKDDITDKQPYWVTLSAPLTCELTGCGDPSAAGSSCETLKPYCPKD